jgi:hypothetical protein
MCGHMGRHCAQAATTMYLQALLHGRAFLCVYLVRLCGHQSGLLAGVGQQREPGG